MHRDRRVPGHAGFPTVTGGCLMMVDRSTGTPHFQPGSQQLIAGIIAHMERTAKIPNPFCIPAFSVPLENIKSWDCREHKIELGVKKTCRYAAGLFCFKIRRPPGTPQRGAVRRTVCKPFCGAKCLVPRRIHFACASEINRAPIWPAKWERAVPLVPASSSRSTNNSHQ